MGPNLRSLPARTILAGPSMMETNSGSSAACLLLLRRLDVPEKGLRGAAHRGGSGARIGARSARAEPADWKLRSSTLDARFIVGGGCCCCWPVA